MHTAFGTFGRKRSAKLSIRQISNIYKSPPTPRLFTDSLHAASSRNLLVMVPMPKAIIDRNPFTLAELSPLKFRASCKQHLCVHLGARTGPNLEPSSSPSLSVSRLIFLLYNCSMETVHSENILHLRVLFHTTVHQCREKKCVSGYDAITQFISAPMLALSTLQTQNH